MKGYVLYNTKAGTKNNVEELVSLENFFDDELRYIDIIKIGDYREFFSGLEKDDYIILAGGDGTINCFVNNTKGIGFNNEILYYPNGTGNDFALDLGYTKGCEPFKITEYLKDLPMVAVKGQKYLFINNVGYGIDGYCSQVGDEMKEKSPDKVNYTAIAIKGLMYDYKPTNARVTVDGEVHKYRKVWLAPTMNGRFYGGGMMPTPDQDRKSGTLSVMVMHGSGKLKTLTVFPSIFKGGHVKHTEMVEILTGHKIKVEFDRPTPLQMDGETILDVTEYKVLK